MLVSSAPEPGSTPALREFEAAFERAFGRRPGPYAALGHAAMETVLGALDRAAADDRGRASGGGSCASTSPAACATPSPGRWACLASGAAALAAFHRVPFDPRASRLPVWPMSTTTAPPPPAALNPTITRTMLTVFVIGDVLGAGIYALVGEVGGEVGGAIWTSFLLAGVLALFTAASYAELVTKYPQAAGAALYVHRAFRSDFFTFVVAFAVMASGVTSAATLATAFGGDYLSEFVDLPTILVGLAFIGVISLINFRGIKESVGINLGLTSIELGGLLLVVAIGAAYLLDGGGDPGRALEFKSGETVPLAILGGASLAFFALIGFEDSVNVAEETRDPSRVLPARAVPRARGRGDRLHARDGDRLDGGPDRQARGLGRPAARGRDAWGRSPCRPRSSPRSRCSRWPTAR